MQKIDYLTYLGQFDRFTDISIFSKKSGFYREYLNELKAYLVGFLDRIKPLHDVDDELAKADSEFEKKWEEGQFN